jgi:copper homeostasis protein CutC
VARNSIRKPYYMRGDITFSKNFHITERQSFQYRLASDIRMAKQLGMDGVVLGLLDEKRRIDVERSARLVKLAHPLPVTFSSSS